MFFFGDEACGASFYCNGVWVWALFNKQRCQCSQYFNDRLQPKHPGQVPRLSPCPSKKTFLSFVVLHGWFLLYFPHFRSLSMNHFEVGLHTMRKQEGVVSVSTCVS